MEKLIGICIAIVLLGVSVLATTGAYAGTPPTRDCDSPDIRAVIARHSQEPAMQERKLSNGGLACESKDGTLLWVFHLLPDGNFTFKATRRLYYYKAEGVVGPERAIAGDTSIDKKTCHDPDVHDFLTQLPDSEPFADQGVVEFHDAHVLLCVSTMKAAFWVFWHEADGTLSYQLSGSLTPWETTATSWDATLPTCSDLKAQEYRGMSLITTIIDLGVHPSSDRTGYLEGSPHPTNPPSTVSRYCTDLTDEVILEFWHDPKGALIGGLSGGGRSWHDRMANTKLGEDFEIDSSDHPR